MDAKLWLDTLADVNAVADLEQAQVQRSRGVDASLQTQKRAEKIAQTTIAAMLYAIPALVCAHAACVVDPDVWWHLRTGQWMMEHHAVPHSDPFSSFGAGKLWVAYSWLFERVIFQLYQRLGLMGIVVYSTAMVGAITVALHRLLQRLCPDFSAAVLLTALAALSMGRLYTPRPWHFSILFLVLELHILYRVRRGASGAALAWLPLLFALWANVHIQFVDGLLVLTAATVEALAARWMGGSRPRASAATMIAALAASALAVCVNPYGWHLYEAAYDLAAQPGVMRHVTELQAMPFRSLSDFGVLLLALGAMASFGWTRRASLFEAAIFSLACFVAFRSQRDVWMIAVVASVVIASRIGRAQPTNVSVRPAWGLPVQAALTVVGTMSILWTGYRVMHINNARLAEDLAREMPVKAVEEVRAKRYPGPLYNDYAWGGYLMWSLRMPVSLDGRASFAGDERLDRFRATWGAEPSWSTDQELASAGLVIGPVKAPLSQLLRLDPRFKLAYEDRLAAVFVPRIQQRRGTP